jgi:hypothetical protein
MTTEISLEILLDSLGFKSWLTITTTFALPIINFLGLIFCLISAWVFFQRKFKDQIFFYYRLLTLVYILHLIHNILFGILYSPQYFSYLDRYWIAVFDIYYNLMSYVLFHYGDVIQICILLTRMKKFNQFIKKYFTFSPKIISLILVFVCLIIDFSIPFTFKIVSFGDYIYNDLNGSKKKAFFYFPTTSEFANSLIGQLIILITFFTMSHFICLIVGITLIVISFIQYRQYLEKKKAEEIELRIKYFEVQDSTRIEIIRPYKFSQRRLHERQSEKKMLYMILIMCSMSILLRIIYIICFVYFVCFYDSFRLLVFGLISASIYTITPTVAIFIFHSFNRSFRLEFKKIISFEKQRNSNSKALINCEISWGFWRR